MTGRDGPDSGRPLPGLVEMRIRYLLADLYTPEGVDMWLAGRKRSFGGESPRALIDRGDAELVLARVNRLHERNV